MRAKLTFPNVAFMQDSGDSLRVKLNEPFTMELVPDDPDTELAPLEWATTRDQVLSVAESPSGAMVNITAISLGTSKVMLLNASLSAVFYLDVEVYDETTIAVGAEFTNVRLK